MKKDQIEKPGTRGVTLRDPHDARRIIRKVISAIFREGNEVQHAGKISNLLIVWLRAWEIEKNDEICRRLEELTARYEELSKRLLEANREAAQRDPGGD